MFKWLKQYSEYRSRQKKKNSGEPYIEIISEGVDPMGRVKIEFDWNDAFIAHLRKNGFDGRSEEEVIEGWFQAITKSNLADFLEEDQLLAEQTRINPTGHPDLHKE